MSQKERKIIDRELKMHLYTVRYDTFERAVKRYGYTGRLTDTMFLEVQDIIRVSVDDLKDRNSITHFYFQNNFGFDHGNYDTQKVLLIGFLHCVHLNTEKAGESLWGILNPDIEETVTKEKVREFLETMCHYAVNVPMTVQSF